MKKRYDLAMWMLLAFFVGILLRHFVDQSVTVVAGITAQEADSIGAVVCQQVFDEYTIQKWNVIRRDGYLSGVKDAMEYNLARCERRDAEADSIWTFIELNLIRQP